MSDTAKGPRIALVGSCQVVGIRAALLKLRPDADVKAWHIGVTPGTKEDIAAELGQYDLIVSQLREPKPDAPLALPRLQETHKKVFYVPTFVFNGFHPDCNYLTLRGQFRLGPLRFLQSAIIAVSYILDVPEQRVLRLFNSLTYSALGYFEAFDTARSLSLRSFSAAGFDLEPHIDGWKDKTGSFMHTLNHPHIQVLTRLAHMIGVRAAFIDEATALPDDVEDTLAAGIRWPVYPEIARRLRLPKETIVFKIAKQEVELATAIPEFYKFYKDIDRADIRACFPARLIEGMENVLAG
jgi:hypothetical protein